MRAALGSLALVAAGCSTAPPTHAHPSAPPTATVEPPAFFRAPAPRTYARTGAARVVVQDPRAPDKWALSPDGRLLAKSGAGLSVFDLDRRVTVFSTLDPSSLHDVAWVGDDTLITSDYGEVSAYDGGTGALVGRVRRACPGAVLTRSGLATLRRADNYDDVELVPFAAPERPLLTLPFAGASVDAVLDLGDGAFAAVTGEDVRAFDAAGKTLWRRAARRERDDPLPAVRCSADVGGTPPASPGCVVHVIEGSNWRILSAVDGTTLSDVTADDVPILRADGGDYRSETKLVRVKIGAAPVRLAHDVPGESLGASPDGRFFAWTAGDEARVDDLVTKRSVTRPKMSFLFGSDGALRLGATSSEVFDLARAASGEKLFEAGSSPRASIKHLGGGRFEATCENGARAVLPVGANDATPTEPTSAMGYGELRVVSPDGKLVATSTGQDGGVSLARVDGSGEPKRLDSGGPTLQLAFTRGSDRLVTAEHLMLVGNFHHVDEAASVRVFDTEKGTLLQSWVAHGFQLSADGATILAEMDLGKGEASVLYDVASGRELARWGGVSNDVVLSPQGSVIFVSPGEYDTNSQVVFRTAYVDAVLGSSKKRRYTLSGRGAVAFDPTGRWLAYAATDAYDDRSDFTLLDLSSDDARRTERLDVPTRGLAFVSSRVVVAESYDGDVQLLDVETHHTVSLRAFDDGDRCRFLAVDDEGRFQGDAGGFVAVRFGDDLRASEISRAPADVEAVRDDQLLQRFFADAR